MLKRLSKVKTTYVNSISISSVLQIGDSHKITPYSRALAVQREYPLIFTNEGDFNEYSVFQRPLPMPPITEDFPMMITNTNPVINVGHVRVTGISASSVVQIGSTNHIEAETRVKHIRQLLRDRKNGDSSQTEATIIKKGND
ncbi:spore germination protein GerPE [Bacillus timonensis]|nr:spore germination protein GerPE [Bacillus timonensis]